MLLSSISGDVIAATKKLTLSDFIQKATANDGTFEEILIDQLSLSYRRTALLPDSDVIADIKLKHNFKLDRISSTPEASVSLNKLFPLRGTEVSLAYDKTPATLASKEASSLQFLISQPIARNAFGKSVQLSDEIIGIENEITRYQIIEAYEDYLASLTSAYYNWYSAYENLKVGQASYTANLKLLDNILERKRQSIALPVDVNKMELLLIGKKENVIVLQEVYDNISNLIFKAIRYNSSEPYIPVEPDSPDSDVNFEEQYTQFKNTSRTYKALTLLELQKDLEIDKAADDLLPSTNLLLGYKLDGDNWNFGNDDSSYFAGISLSWPIGRSVDKARQSITRIERKKTILSNKNKHEELQLNLKTLYLQIIREKKLIEVAQKKIKLAISILKDEAENYSFGKVTLNDYIDAVNRVDENRFSYTEHTVQLNKLLVEWLRLSDQLVDETVLNQ